MKGKFSLKVVLLFLSKYSTFPWCKFIVPCTWVKPKPDPLVLPETNGLNNISFKWSGTPLPLSAISTVIGVTLFSFPKYFAFGAHKEYEV